MKLKDIFLGTRDGLEPEDVYRMTGWVQRLLPPYLSLVAVPVWLSGKGERSSANAGKNWGSPEKAQFILDGLFRRLNRNLHAFKPPQTARSAWSAYMESNSYSKDNFGLKEDFVATFLKDNKPKQLLDVGANTGHFSFLGAQAGAAVVAIDSDPACIGNIWRKACETKQDVLPLVVDLARPSPALGWRNQECSSFLRRATGSFDAVFMLAVSHHLMVTERAPLEDIIDLSASLTRTWLIIEFVGPQDEMFRKIARGRDHLFVGWTVSHLKKPAVGITRWFVNSTCPIVIASCTCCAKRPSR